MSKDLLVGDMRISEGIVGEGGHFSGREQHMQRPETVYGQKVTVAGTEGQANNGGAGHVRHLVVDHGPDTGFYVEVESDLECFEQSVYINDVHVNKK